MPLNRNTLLRLRTIDACLQRRHRRWTLEDLRQACEDALYEYEGICGISTRTIQRDIELMRGEKLGYFAPIVVREKKYYEYEDPDFSMTRLPLNKQDLTELSSAMDIIRHYQSFQAMNGGEDILARMQDKIQAQKSHKQVVYIDTNERLKGLEHLAPLYDYIIKKIAIVIDYQSFKSNRQSQFYMSAYILKEFNNRWFVIGYCSRKHCIMTLALDRIICMKKDVQRNYIENTFFSPKEYFDSMVGVTRDMNSKTERVIVKIDENQAKYVLTKPLHQSQTIIETRDDGSVVLSLDVILNYELERLLLGYGSHIEVISPNNLRHQIARQVLIASEKYKSQ